MNATAERKYALTKIDAGDYLLPSNDAQTLWRIAKYEDGPSYGLDDWPRDVTLWRVSRYTQPFDPNNPDPDALMDWGNWEGVSDCLVTRAKAIAEALTKS